ncbi:hypothetical protein AAFF_G00337660 [Aldrovandia affinis]|uniref:ARID domain-containing protein n=1 Tax=Aldrovandia affinis TaxID=143900 RepID=A0AAD7SKW8_9TELE|nr:hypothetical protein AAFF_G00337660 [Aldrovandia affinis]
MSQERKQGGATMEPETEMTEEAFLKELYVYMKNRDTPIERIPHLGFKQIDLFVMFQTVQGLGGYNQVTAHQLWKQVYNKLGGNPRSTSAATCTRRHYEKLILPYECYLRGEDDKNLSSPRQQKRSRYNSFLNEDDEALRDVKRSAAYGHVPIANQNPHEFLADRVRIIPMPVHFRQYLHPSSPGLPAYLQVSPTMPTPQPHPDTRALYLPVPLEVNEGPKQLKLLRELAHDYISSSGWAEPLNLSRKEGSIGSISQQPSSFTPTSSNKMPKFLNKVFPLYQTSSVAKEEESEVSDNNLATSKTGPVRAGICPLPTQERYVIDLTSSSSSHNISPVMDPAIKTKDFSLLHLQNNDLAAQDVATTKILETDLQSKEEGEASKASQSPLNLSRPPMSPFKDSTGRMEIQIPLAVLQNWFKGNFGSGLRHKPSTIDLQSGGSQLAGGEAESQRLMNTDVSQLRDRPSDLTFRDHPRNRWSSVWRHRYGSLNGVDRKFTGSFLKESQPTNHDRYANIGHHRHPFTHGIKAEEWEPGTDCRGGSALHHSDVFPKSVTGNNPYHWMYLQDKDYAARKSSSKGLVEAQDLVLGKGSTQVQPATRQSPPYPHGQEQGSTSPLSLACRTAPTQSSTSPTRLEPRETSRSMTSTILMVNPTSPSLQPLTHEEYLKLRRLISSSP